MHKPPKRESAIDAESMERIRCHDIEQADTMRGMTKLECRMPKECRTPNDELTAL